MLKELKNTPFWNVLRRGSALTLALIVVISTCILPTFAADDPTEPTEPVYSEGLAYSFSGTNATVTGPGTWTGGELRIPPQVTVDGVTYAVTAIGANAFESNMLITALVMPQTVSTIGNYAFSGCSNLTSFTGGLSLTAGQYAFANCPRLFSLDFSTWSTIGENVFYSSGMETVVVPPTVISIQASAFDRSSLKYLFYSYPTTLQLFTGKLGDGLLEIHYSGSLSQYINSVFSSISYTLFKPNTSLYINGEMISGHLNVPSGVTLQAAFSGLTSISSLFVPSDVSFGSATTMTVFEDCTNLKNVYFDANFPGSGTSVSRAIFDGCTGLENFYYNGSQTILTYKNTFYRANTTFTLYLPGSSDYYTLSGFSNPVVYDSVFVAPDFQYLYTDSNIITNKGGSISATLQPLKNYGLPDTVDVTDTSGTSLGWTNGVEYTYNSTTGQFTVPALNQNIQLHAVGVSLVPQYYFFNETPQFINFIGDQFTFEATDFNGSVVTGAFMRLEDERLCFYQIVAEEDVLAWADDTGWVSPLYRYLDFGSYEIGEDLAYFLRTTASVPSIGSMLAQIYNASGGGSSGGSYEDGYTAGYNEGYNAGYAAGSAGNGSGGALGIVDSVLALATYRLDFIQGGQVVHSMNVTPQYNLGSVYFGTLDIVNAIADYEENNGDIDGVNVVCTWADSDNFDFGQFPLYVSGTSLVASGTLLTSDDVSLSLEAPWVDGSSTQDLRRFEITSAEIPTIVFVKSVSISVGRPQDLLQEFTLCSSTYFFNQGYSQGYTVGYSVGSSEVSTESYNTGYHNGFIEGKSEGITIAEKGNFYNLFFSVSDAVYSNFLNLLNFEVLGVNMKVVFGSFLTVCLVLIVIFKFTGKN